MALLLLPHGHRGPGSPGSWAPDPASTAMAPPGQAGAAGKAQGQTLHSAAGNSLFWWRVGTWKRRVGGSCCAGMNNFGHYSL